MLLLSAGSANAEPNGNYIVNLHEPHIGAHNPGFQAGECPVGPTSWGWHFVAPPQGTIVAGEWTFDLDAGGSQTITSFISHPNEQHAYVYTDGLATLTGGWVEILEGTVANKLVLSHVCSGETEPDLYPFRVVKYHDQNSNGQEDMGEPRLAGWTFNWTASDGQSGQLVTGADGTASTGNLFAEGVTVQVTEVVQPGWFVTTANPAGTTIIVGTAEVKFGNNFETEETPNSCQSMTLQIVGEGDGWITALITVNAVVNQDADGVMIDFGDSNAQYVEGTGPWSVEHTFYADGNETFVVTATVYKDGVALEGLCVGELSVEVTTDECVVWIWADIHHYGETEYNGDPFGFGQILNASTGCRNYPGFPDAHAFPMTVRLQVVHPGTETPAPAIFNSAFGTYGDGIGFNFTLSGNTASFTTKSMGQLSGIHYEFQWTPLIAGDCQVLVTACATHPITGALVCNKSTTGALTVDPNITDAPPADWLPLWAATSGYTTVKNGEDIAAVAARIGMDAQTLMNLNWHRIVLQDRGCLEALGANDCVFLYEGMRLQTTWHPAMPVAIVVSNQTLAEIANTYALTVEELMNFNRLQSANTMPGQVILLPQ